MNFVSKTCLITGATSGIGKVTATALANTGATVVLAARNTEKAEKVKNEIIQSTGNNKIDVMSCDLSSFDSIRKFAVNFRSKYNSIDILINNAGTWETERKESADGIELMLAVNHLGPFLLTNLLLDMVKTASCARIINVSSNAHKMGKMNFDDPEAKKNWKSLKMYSESKLANILFTKKLAKILLGSGVTVNCLHPGVVSTHLFDKMSGLKKFVFGLFMISPKKGAETSIYLATSSEVQNITGQYFAKKKISRSTVESNDMKIAERLWEISKQYVKL